MLKIKLADHKVRSIQYTMVTSFWHPDGTPMSSQQFLDALFGKFPEFLEDEAELRTIWIAPDARAKRLEGLAEKGFGKEQMTEMQRIIDTEKSDLFDVLGFVAFALAPLTREERDARAKIQIQTQFDDKQQAFLDSVLAKYVKVGIRELDQRNVTQLIKLKYNDPRSDAIADLGPAEQIRNTFTGFQKYLY